MADDRARTALANGAGHDSRWADLADLTLIISREIQFRGYTDERATSLSPSEGMVMRYLRRTPDAAPSGIAAATGLQRTNLSAVLRGLERKGLIERHACPDDRRGVSVRLTERGSIHFDVVHHEWAMAVSAAAGDDTKNLDSSLAMLRAVAEGLIKTRPRGTPS